jgi:hypothetical protein
MEKNGEGTLLQALCLDEIGEWLGLALYHDQPIPTSTLHDNLKELGLTQNCTESCGLHTLGASPFAFGNQHALW